MIIHADYLLEGTLKAIKITDGFTFTNPRILKLLKEEIFKGENSKPRNSRMQTMLRMVGYGDNAGSGFPPIVLTWASGIFFHQHRWLKNSSASGSEIH